MMTDKPVYVTRYTWTDNKPQTKTKKQKVVVGTETVEKSGLLGKKTIEKELTETQEVEVPTGKGLTGFPNIEDLAKRIQNLCNSLHVDGYNVLSITPVQIGDWDSWSVQTGGAGYGMGITRGAIVTGKLRK